MWIFEYFCILTTDNELEKSLSTFDLKIPRTNNFCDKPLALRGVLYLLNTFPVLKQSRSVSQ